MTCILPQTTITREMFFRVNGNGSSFQSRMVRSGKFEYSPKEKAMVFRKRVRGKRITLKYRASDLTLSLDEFSEKYIAPALRAKGFDIKPLGSSEA